MTITEEIINMINGLPKEEPRIKAITRNLAVKYLSILSLNDPIITSVFKDVFEKYNSDNRRIDAIAGIINKELNITLSKYECYIKIPKNGKYYYKRTNVYFYQGDELQQKDERNNISYNKSSITEELMKQDMKACDFSSILKKLHPENNTNVTDFEKRIIDKMVTRLFSNNLTRAELFEFCKKAGIEITTI